MADLIHVRNFPNPANLAPEQIDDFFAENHEVDEDLGTVLLENESLAIYHLNVNRYDQFFTSDDEQRRELDTPIPSGKLLRPVLLGVNYHLGHSEGYHKIIVQDVVRGIGPWVLFHPPGSNQKVFYLQDMVFPFAQKPRFEESVANSLKIQHHLFFRGDPMRIFMDFEKAGYVFNDGKIAEGLFDELSDLSYKSQHMSSSKK